MSKLSIAVIIPTFRRIPDLLKCLEGLQKQTRKADEVIVVARDIDPDTRIVLENSNFESLNLKVETVTIPGFCPAQNIGVRASTCDIVAGTDDDAIPRPDWLARIEDFFLSDEQIVGVGGRDWIHVNDLIISDSVAIVGKILWYGKTFGNHHLGAGQAREVDMLKGVNCAYRRAIVSEIEWDERLKGVMAHHELMLGLKLKRLGLKLIYDPEIAVDHFPAAFLIDGPRDEFNYVRACDLSHNETLAFLENNSLFKNFGFLLYAFLIGNSGSFGLVQAILRAPKYGKQSLDRLIAAYAGRIDGLRTWYYSRQKRKK